MASADNVNDVVLVQNGSADDSHETVRKVVKVPDDARARLMYYLHCINNVLDIDTDQPNLQKLIDYENYFKLSKEELEDLLVLCILFFPGSLTDVCIFHDEDYCGHFENEFIEKTESYREKYNFLDSIVLGNRRYDVHRCMLYCVSFLETNYFEPMLYFNSILERLKVSSRRLSNNSPTVSTCCAIL